MRTTSYTCRNCNITYSPPPEICIDSQKQKEWIELKALRKENTKLWDKWYDDGRDLKNMPPFMNKPPYPDYKYRHCASCGIDTYFYFKED